MDPPGADIVLCDHEETDVDGCVVVGVWYTRVDRRPGLHNFLLQRTGEERRTTSKGR